MIEEPENYLHPWMQVEFRRMLRERCEEDKDLLTVLVSTHSETVVNCAKPDEVILCNMRDGITEVSRPSNADQLSKEINKSGFGLGYFYVSGAVDDA